MRNSNVHICFFCENCERIFLWSKDLGILDHFGAIWVILGDFGSLWSFWSFLTWIGQKGVFGHISCPPAPISKIQEPVDAEFQCAPLLLYAKIVTATFFGSKIHFFIFRLRVKGFFLLGFSFSSSVGTFQREREFFFGEKIFFYSRKITIPNSKGFPLGDYYMFWSNRFLILREPR